MKKLLFLLLVFAFLLIGCEGKTTTLNSTTVLPTNATTSEFITYTTEEDSDTITLIKHIYSLAMEADAFTGTYEEWLETVRGPEGLPGEDGREIIIGVSTTHIQWKYVDDEEWTNLIDLNLLVGEKGDQGLTGIPGEDGEPGLSAYEIYLSYHPDYVGDEEQWISDLVYGRLGEMVTVSFDTNGGDALDQITVYKGDAITLPIPYKEGHSFTGWITGLGVNDGKFTNAMPVVADLTLYATWQINFYTLEFETYGGTEIDDIANYYGEIVIEPEIPTKTGYTFLGWYADEEFTEEFYFTTIPGQNMTIYVKWEPNIYEITYIEVNQAYQDLDIYSWVENESIISLNSGYAYNIVLTSEGRVFAWGENGGGQLGDGSLNNRNYPVETTVNFSLNEGEIITQIFSGYSHSFAITNENRLFAWGRNNLGQLGDGTTIDRAYPTDVSDVVSLNPNESIVKIDMSSKSTFILTDEGRLFAWGLNNVGQLGDGTQINKSAPIETTGYFSLVEGETLIDVICGENHTLAITSEFRVFTWGNNTSGELGDGTNTLSTSPIDITNNFSLDSLENVIKISTNDNFNIAITNQGRVFTWGKNYYGQLGDGTTTDSNLPIDITSNLNLSIAEVPIDISCGAVHMMLLTSENRLFTWGYNLNGQLGDGTNDNSTLPIDISDNLSLNDMENIDLITVGGMHNLILTSSCRLIAWGYNNYGQIGDATNNMRINPVEISFITYLKILAIEEYACDEILVLLNPEMLGYTLDGWYEELDLTALIEFTQMPPEDLIIYGQFIKVE